MSNYYIGEIRIWACSFPPRDWAFCNGQIIPIQQNTALFSIIGTYYGGDGRTTFGLPQFQGRAAVDQGQGTGLTTRMIGEEGGEAAIALLTSEMPVHNHVANGAIPGSGSGADELTGAPSTQAWLGASTPGANYSGAASNTTLSPYAIGIAGSSLPHNNMQPFLAMNFCIALYGVFPARN